MHVAVLQVPGGGGDLLVGELLAAVVEHLELVLEPGRARTKNTSKQNEDLNTQQLAALGYEICTYGRRKEGTTTIRKTTPMRLGQYHKKTQRTIYLPQRDCGFCDPSVWDGQAKSGWLVRTQPSPWNNFSQARHEVYVTLTEQREK